MFDSIDHIEEYIMYNHARGRINLKSEIQNFYNQLINESLTLTPINAKRMKLLLAN